MHRHFYYGVIAGVAMGYWVLPKVMGATKKPAG